jgi:hypothetical protein
MSPFTPSLSNEKLIPSDTLPATTMSLVTGWRLWIAANNFLKDITDIEKEIEYESKKQAGLVSEGNFVPIEQALLSPMEENY